VHEIRLRVDHPGFDPAALVLAGRIDIGQTGVAKYMMSETARHRGNGFVGCANARTAH
jgi:hypothetical protein